MLPYWILFSAFAFVAVQDPVRGNSRRRLTPLLVLAGSIIALMIGLRFQVGADWIAYERIFFHIGWLNLFEALAYGDPAYSLLNWLVNAAGLNIWAVNLICGVIFSWGLIRFAAIQSNPWLTIVVAIPYLVIVVAMGFTRQAVAIGIVLAALSRVDQIPVWRFAIYILAAVLFHKSAIIVLPIVALAAKQSRPVTIAILAATAVMLYYFFIQESLGILVTVYIEGAYEAEGAQIRVAMNIVPALLFLLFHKRFNIIEQQRRLWRNFSYAALAALFFLFAVEGSTAVDRLALYLIPLQLFVYGNLPAVLGARGANRLIQTGIIVYSALVMFVWMNYAQHASQWIPYELFPLGSDAPLVSP